MSANHSFSANKIEIAVGYAKRFGAALALAACTPLQQAPLVYSSAITVGARVGVAPTNAEAAEIVVGYKALDTAYAPVAVSRPELDQLIAKGGTLDPGAITLFKLEDIYGVYGSEGADIDVLKSLSPTELNGLKELATKLANVTLTSNALEAATANAIAASKVQVAADKLVNAVKSLPLGDPCASQLQAVLSSPPAMKDLVKAATDCTASKQSQLTAQLDTDIRALSSETRTQSVIATDTKAKADARDSAQSISATAVQSADEARTSAASALQKLASVKKRDAISVYGSFNSNTDAGASSSTTGGVAAVKPASGESTPIVTTPGVHLAIGKVFSTGVAAQNLSEAQKSIADAATYTACVQTVSALVQTTYPDPAASGAADQRKTMAGDLFLKCQGVAPKQATTAASK